mgnify:CR=1 FL=1|jgi:thiosulfate dehydrogenase [quinone] large subunit
MAEIKLSFISTETAWGILRIFLGYSWFMSGIGKIGHFNGQVLTGILQSWISGAPPRVPPNPHAWYVSFLKATVIPHADLFAKLVVYGEILTGIALFIGALTFLAALMGIFLNANFYFAAAHTSPAVQGINALYIVVQIIMLLVGAGMFYGVDKYLFGRVFKKKTK